MALNISNCNLIYPKLRVTPSYGEAIRYHAEFRGEVGGIGDVGSYGGEDELQRYVATGELVVSVDWGCTASDSAKLSKFVFEVVKPDGLVCEHPTVELTVRGIGRRPAMTLLASSASEVHINITTGVCIFEATNVAWKHSKQSNGVQYPEYLVTLELSHGNRKILQRTLHVVPPQIGPLKFSLGDIAWAPGLFHNDEEKANTLIHSLLNGYTPKTDAEVIPQQRRRGFGLELETVQLPQNEEDCEAGCFTHQQQFQQSVERARQWHLRQISLADVDYDATTKVVNEMWDQFARWSVSHDLYVENAAPPSRIDLYQRIKAHIADAENQSPLSDIAHSDKIHELDDLVLGGRVEMPLELLSSTPYVEVPISQASPEYKSPPPPYELHHAFPPRHDGKDKADASIRLFLDGIMKNPAVSSKPVIVPLVSDIGQSASSIHVHVNIINPTAWPRKTMELSNDMEDTKSLLCVIFGWICFDQVVQNFVCLPNVWRDRSFAPMLCTGPEFSWREPSWEHGHSTVSLDDDGNVKDAKLYNIPAFFRHVFSCYKSAHCQEEKKESPTSLFDTIFDQEVLLETLSRWNSLNLISLKMYGTVEFRRMHASLNADFVSAWTWLCVGFVEKFSSPVMFDKFLYPFLEGIGDWKVGLERLAEAQNNATFDDLKELMCEDLPTTVFEALLKSNH